MKFPPTDRLIGRFARVKPKVGAIIAQLLWSAISHLETLRTSLRFPAGSGHPDAIIHQIFVIPVTFPVCLLPIFSFPMTCKLHNINGLFFQASNLLDIHQMKNPKLYGFLDFIFRIGANRLGNH